MKKIILAGAATLLFSVSGFAINTAAPTKQGQFKIPVPIPPSTSASAASLYMIKQCRVLGTVNGQKIEGNTFQGSLDEKSGKRQLTYRFDDLPVNVRFFLPFASSGCPAGKTASGVDNPFAGDYNLSYLRDVVFDSGEVLHVKAQCGKINKVLNATFELSGNIPKDMGEFKMDPFIETVSQDRSGEFVGEVNASFLNSDDRRIRVHSTSHYNFEGEKSKCCILLKAPLYNSNRVNLNVQGREVGVDESTTYFSGLPE